MSFSVHFEIILYIMTGLNQRIFKNEHETEFHTPGLLTDRSPVYINTKAVYPKLV